MKLKCRVIDYHSQPIKKDDGSNFQWEYAIVRTDTGMIRLTSAVDLSSYRDKDVEIDLELKGDSQMKPKVKIVAVK